MNGFIKKNDKKVYPFNSTKNIEHKGIRLFDYIELLKKNIINLFNINQKSILGVKFAEKRITSADTYQDIDYTTEYLRTNQNEDFYLNANGIYIKSLYKKNLTINIGSNVRADSGVDGYRYLRVEQWRNGSMIDSEFTTVYQRGNDRNNLFIPILFKVTYNDCIKIKIYGKTSDTFLLTRVNMELSKNDNINYYDF